MSIESSTIESTDQHMVNPLIAEKLRCLAAEMERGHEITRTLDRLRDYGVTIEIQGAQAQAADLCEEILHTITKGDVSDRDVMARYPRNVTECLLAITCERTVRGRYQLFCDLLTPPSF